MISQGYPENYTKSFALKAAKNSALFQFKLINNQFPNVYGRLTQNMGNQKTLFSVNPMLLSKYVKTYTKPRKRKSYKKHK